MFTYQKFLVKENDRFHAVDFPRVDENLEQIVAKLGKALPDTHIDMLLSFAKDHSISSVSLKEYPELASLISSKTLSLGTLEDLFESSRKNQAFQSDLTAYIRAYFSTAEIVS